METSKGFRDEYAFLSNFTPLEKPLQYGSLTFNTVEHFYIAMKTLDQTNRLTISKHPLKGLKAFGRTLVLRDNWEDIKLDVMLYGLRYKFSKNNPTLQQKLLSTGDTLLVEYNWWNDKFWGVCLKTGVGENNLGKLLMQVRSEVEGNGER